MSNGTATLNFGTTPLDNPAAILPFSPPPIAYEVSVDVAIEPERIGDWLGLGFSSSNAVNHNLETAGQAWMKFKMNDPWVRFVQRHGGTARERLDGPIDNDSGDAP
ncbi:MAG: hypothetical protein WDO73_19850 [Ignavibacteriota bacterium]